VSKNETHITQLDGLRFLAVSLVMFAHWIQWRLNNQFIQYVPFSHGVILFFVLSGFLITRILLENKDKYEQVHQNKSSLVKSFYIRRALRILPLYYTVLFAVYAINYSKSHELFPWLATFTINIYQSVKNVATGDFNHFWSLAVEEQFYLVWPWVILFTPRKYFLKIIAVLIVLSIAYKAYIYFFVHKWMAGAYSVSGCADALCLGALVAYLFLYHKSFSLKMSSAALCWLLFFLYLINLFAQFYFKAEALKNIFDEFLFALLAACIINRAAHKRFSFAARYILENKWVVYGGKISYGMYLYHLFIPFIYFYVKSKTGFHVDNLFLYFLVLYGVTFILAHFSWVLFERPINNLKKKFPYFKEE
jgi:peptidoglycan/LPS O-acetylase OafA/YrhL